MKPGNSATNYDLKKVESYELKWKNREKWSRKKMYS